MNKLIEQKIKAIEGELESSTSLVKRYEDIIEDYKEKVTREKLIISETKDALAILKDLNTPEKNQVVIDNFVKFCKSKGYKIKEDDEPLILKGEFVHTSYIIQNCDRTFAYNFMRPELRLLEPEAYKLYVDGIKKEVIEFLR